MAERKPKLKTIFARKVTEGDTPPWTEFEARTTGECALEFAKSLPVGTHTVETYLTEKERFDIVVAEVTTKAVSFLGLTPEDISKLPLAPETVVQKQDDELPEDAKLADTDDQDA